MSMVNPSILVVDDDPVAADLLTEVLGREGYRVKMATSGADAVRMGEADRFDMVITDLNMPGLNGLEVLRAFKRSNPQMATIVITAFGSFETAIEAIKNGAYDYISKPFKMEEIKSKVKRGLEQTLLYSPQHGKPDEKISFKAIVGNSPSMLEAFKTIAKAAVSDATVLIQGESGTGKELAAKAIHDNSHRASKPFVTINCAAIPENLLESELFGYVKGAFTNAVADKKGLFEEANGGICFLDEIGDTPPALQSKLLRVLQNHEIRRLGGKQNINIDIRVIAATNKDLDSMVKKGAFREDLFYRLHVITLTLPPLREHIEDVSLLAEHFLRITAIKAGKEVHGFSKEAMEVLVRYDWPGNVRQLGNLIERAVALTNNKVLLPSDLPAYLYEKKDLGARSIAAQNFSTIDELKKNHIIQVLKHVNGNQNMAADILGINRKTLYRLLKKWGI